MKNATPTMDPPQVIASFTAPKSLTLGQILLLQKVASPFLNGTPTIDWLAGAPSLYITALPFEEALKVAEKDFYAIQTEAIAWANHFTREDWAKALEDLQVAIRDFFSLLPAASKEEKRKNP